MKRGSFLHKVMYIEQALEAYLVLTFGITSELEAVT
jgi:hypothetical protein